MTIRIEKVKGLEDAMIGWADDIDALGLDLFFCRQQRVVILDFKREVLHPLRCIAIPIHRLPRWQLKKGQYIAHTSIQEDMHVRIRFLGRGHAIFGERDLELHAQDTLVEVYGLPGIVAAISNMMNAFDIHRNLLCSISCADDTSGNLVPLDGFEQSFEIALAEAFIFLALNEFEKHRADKVGRKNLQQQSRIIVFG